MVLLHCCVMMWTGTNVHEQSRSDICRLRFKTEGVSRMYALSRDVIAPGVVVYNSGRSQCVRDVILYLDRQRDGL